MIQGVVRPLRLAFICEHYFPEIGGLERSTHRLARALRKKGVQVTVLAPSWPERADKDLLDDVPIVRSPHDAACAFTDSPDAHRVIADADACICFGIGEDVHARLWWPVFEARGKPAFLKIGTAGDTLVKGVPGSLIRRFDGIFCQNDDIIEEAVNLGFERADCVRIRNGLDIGEWQAQLLPRSVAMSALGLPANSPPFVIAALGRFVRRKRFPDIVCAFREFASTSVPALLLLHGSDFHQSDGEEAHLRDLLDRIDLPPTAEARIIGPDVPSVHTLAASDVSVSLGTREGAPNIILESLASGVPVIASDISGHRVYITPGQEGWLCDDIASLPRVMHQAFRSDRARMGPLCRAKAAQFDIEATSQVYLDAVRNTLQARPSYNVS